MASRIYTKTGDDGTTGLFGGSRVSKDALRIHSYGTVDELNAVLGLAVSGNVHQALAYEVTHLMSILFVLGSDLATPQSPSTATMNIPRITLEHTAWLEERIDSMEKELPPLKNFILPGGTQPAAALHLARTVCRRAERTLVQLAGTEEIGDNILRFVNRLSDYLFVLARYTNHTAGIPDILWNTVRTSE